MICAEDLERVVHRIVEHFDPERVILFGSHARGDASEDSDVDLLIVADTDLSPRQRYPEVRRLLADFPVAFDVFWKTPEEYRRWRSVVNHVVYFADKYGKVVHERGVAGSSAPVGRTR